MMAITGGRRRFVIGLAGANFVLLATIGALLAAPNPPLAAPPTVTLPGNSFACQSLAAQEMTEQGIGGSVAIRADGSIEFQLSGEDATEAWDAFAASAKLPEHKCGPYDPIRIDVSDPSLVPNQRLVVEARWADVLAWSQGRIDDQTLSDRTSRTTYARPRMPVVP